MSSTWQRLQHERARDTKNLHQAWPYDDVDGSALSALQSSTSSSTHCQANQRRPNPSATVLCAQSALHPKTIFVLLQEKLMLPPTRLTDSFYSAQPSSSDCPQRLPMLQQGTRLVQTSRLNSHAIAAQLSSSGSLLASFHLWLRVPRIGPRPVQSLNQGPYPGHRHSTTRQHDEPRLVALAPPRA